MKVYFLYIYFRRIRRISWHLEQLFQFRLSYHSLIFECFCCVTETYPSILMRVKFYVIIFLLSPPTWNYLKLLHSSSDNSLVRCFRTGYLLTLKFVQKDQECFTVVKHFQYFHTKRSFLKTYLYASMFLIILAFRIGSKAKEMFRIIKY